MTTAPRRDPLSLRHLHEFLGGELIGSPDSTVIDVASLEQAGPGDLAFLASALSSESPVPADAMASDGSLAITSPL